MAWKKVKIKDIFDFEKGPLQSSKNTPWEYDFITASSERKTHNTFSHEWEYLIFAMAASGSLWRTHYVNWKFISSDLCFIITPKNPEQINMRFYHIYFNLIRKDIVSKTATWSAKIAINQNNFWNYEIISWNIEDQNNIFNKINWLAPNIEKLLDIFDDQTLVKRLRQSILQDAIQGKLVPQNSNDEPASELLKKIRLEKEQIIKDKKIKKGKDSSPITDNENPFDLPKGWTQTNIGEIFEFINGAAHEQFVSDEGNYILVNSRFVSTNWQTKKYSKELLTPLYINDIAIVMSDVPCWRAIARTFLVGKDNVYTLNQRIWCLRIQNNVSHKFLSMVVNRNPYFLDFDDKKKQTNLRRDQILWCPILLPPLAEQQRIVAKVDELMKFCDDLEKQISEAKENGERLMESVLGEVFK